MRWPEVTLDSIAEISGGSTPRRNIADYWEGNILWVTPSDLPMPGQAIGEVDDTESKITEAGLKSCSTKLLDVGSVLFSSRATIGKVGIALQKLATNQGFTNFTPRPCVTGKWLAYVLMYRRDDIAKLAGSTTFKEVSKSAIRQYKIPLPPLSEQRKIVELLDQADALRKRRAAADQKAERILPALFYKMFGDPATNPMGWKVLPMGSPSVAEINPRLTRSSVDNDTMVSFIPMADVDEVWGRKVGTQTRSYADVKKGFTYFAEGDVLFAKITPCMENGKAALAKNLQNGIGYGSTEFHVLRPGIETRSEWLYGLVRLPIFRDQARTSFTGSAGQQRVPTNFLKQFMVPVPPLGLQDRFADCVNAMYDRVKIISSTREKIDMLFTTMLHRAFSGELTAKWREAHMQELLREMEIQARELVLEEVAS